MRFEDQPMPRFIRTIFYVHVRQNGTLAPFFEDFQTENQAKIAAEKKAKSMGLPLVFVDWRHDLKESLIPQLPGLPNRVTSVASAGKNKAGTILPPRPAMPDFPSSLIDFQHRFPVGSDAKTPSAVVRP